MKRWLGFVFALTLALGCLGAAGAEAPVRKLIECEYAIFGGMENASFSMTLKRGQDADVLTIVERDRGFWTFLTGARRYQASPWALSDLDALLARYAPETWRDLPDSELIALDAPTEEIRLTYDDGAYFSITDAKELPDGNNALFSEVYQFLESYSARDAQTVTLSFSSFSGGGPEYALTLDAPEKVDWYRQERMDGPEAPGAGFEVVYAFRGRIPGIVHATVTTTMPLASAAGGSASHDTVYTLSIDKHFNVSILPREGE